MSDPIIVSVGTTDLTFNADDQDFNQYINEQTSNDKIAPAWNFISRTVDDADRENLNRLALNENKMPRGIIVLQIAAVIVQQLGGDLTVTVKKPSSVQTKPPKMVTSN